MGIAEWVIGAAVAALVIDRAMVAAERRGWVYWRQRGRGTATGAAMAEIQAMFAPTHRIPAEERLREELVGDTVDAAAPPGGVDLEQSTVRVVPPGSARGAVSPTKPPS